MASPAVADGAAVWEAFRHLCQGSHYPVISQCFRFLVSLGKKRNLWVTNCSLSENIFFCFECIPFRNTRCNIYKKKNHPKLQTSSSALKGARHDITSADFWNLNAIVKKCEVVSEPLLWSGWMMLMGLFLGWRAGWDLAFVHFEDIWLLELQNNSPVGFFPTYFLQTPLDRLSIFCTLLPVQWAVSSPVTHFLSHQNYRPPPQQLDGVCVCTLCVCEKGSVCGEIRRSPFPEPLVNTDTNVSPRASIKLCRPSFSCLPTTSVSAREPVSVSARRRTLEMIPSVWHESETICPWSHPDTEVTDVNEINAD